MDIRHWLGRTYHTMGRIADAREQFRTALAVPGADTYPVERALVIKGLEDCH
ncbi:hypothetical protein [Streptomyces sp. HD]|uniref:hypothetical protein n=1 Tax=Streptomyces sp. HD TaxID=3020892 RepID=UPI00232B7C85|nr:hypothetical protein [Streptomyces sp. HD]MDC0773992.1 hypothetical protein [Streptomyces sp. HD]